jgi:predicted acyltransferase
MMALIPVPGFGAGDYSMEGSLAGYIDRMLLPGVLYNKVHDPEGILSTLPAIATALMGSITGNLLLRPDQAVSRMRKFYILLAAGVVAMLVGWLWGQLFPINKNLWTSSFVLFAGGLSLLFLALFYLVIDVWGFKRWSFFFVVIGMNAITIYLLQAGMLSFWETTDYFLGGIAGKLSEGWSNLLMSIGYVTAVWLLLYFFYKRKIFLRV